MIPLRNFADAHRLRVRRRKVASPAQLAALAEHGRRFGPRIAAPPSAQEPAGDASPTQGPPGSPDLAASPPKGVVFFPSGERAKVYARRAGERSRERAAARRLAREQASTEGKKT